jgi:hypothetical protein
MVSSWPAAAWGTDQTGRRPKVESAASGGRRRRWHPAVPAAATAHAFNGCFGNRPYSLLPPRPARERCCRRFGERCWPNERCRRASGRWAWETCAWLSATRTSQSLTSRRTHARQSLSSTTRSLRRCCRLETPTRHYHHRSVRRLKQLLPPTSTGGSGEGCSGLIQRSRWRARSLQRHWIQTKDLSERARQ